MKIKMLGEPYGRFIQVTFPERITFSSSCAHCDRDAPLDEELVAELGAAMVCASLGVPLDKLQHTSYIQSWLKHLKDDTSFVFKAAADASKAVKYLTKEVA